MNRYYNSKIYVIGITIMTILLLFLVIFIVIAEIKFEILENDIGQKETKTYERKIQNFGEYINKKDVYLQYNIDENIITLIADYKTTKIYIQDFISLETKTLKFQIGKEPKVINITVYDTQKDLNTIDKWNAIIENKIYKVPYKGTTIIQMPLNSIIEVINEAGMIKMTYEKFIKEIMNEKEY